MTTGTIKFFNKAKGFGFITPDDGGKDIFLPAGTIAAAGAAKLKPGQRVTFDQEADTKGPKAVNLVVVPGEVVPVAPPAAPKAPAAAPRPSLTVYYDGESEDAEDVIETLKERGHDPRLVDYRVTPPNKDELKRISIMLHETGQNLVRRYDTMFFELQLDDRFIGEAEYWTAIHEHPQLINGPVVIANGRARICKTEGEVRAFLGDDKPEVPKTKGMSPRMLAILAGDAPPPEPKPAAVAEKKPAAAPAKPAAKATAKPAEKKPAAKPATKAKPAKAAAKPKPAAKPAKKAAAKKKK